MSKIVWPDTILRVATSSMIKPEKLKDTEKAQYLSNLYVLVNKKLTPREHDIFFMRYKKGMSCEEIGAVYNLGKQRISQIILKINRKLQNRKKYIIVGDIMDEIERLEIEYSNRLIELHELIDNTKKKIKVLRDDVPEYIAKILEERNPKIDEDLTIEDLELSVRAYNCLKRAGYKYIIDFEGKTLDDIMTIRNLGRISFNEIIEKLKEHKALHLLNLTEDEEENYMN